MHNAPKTIETIATIAKTITRTKTALIFLSLIANTKVKMASHKITAPTQISKNGKTYKKIWINVAAYLPITKLIPKANKTPPGRATGRNPFFATKATTTPNTIAKLPTTIKIIPKTTEMLSNAFLAASQSLPPIAAPATMQRIPTVKIIAASIHLPKRSLTKLITNIYLLSQRGIIRAHVFL